MATYGGTDTSGLANADYQGRQAKLKAQMDHAQQVNQGLQGAGQQIQGGLDRGAQGAENMYGRQLEAARSGLELDPKSGKYVETKEEKEKRAFNQGATTRELDIREKGITQHAEEFKAEQGIRAQHSQIEAGRLALDAKREERLNIKESDDIKQWMQDRDDKINKQTNDLINDIQGHMLKAELGDNNSRNEVLGIMGRLAQMDPSAAKAYGDFQANPGAAGKESLDRMKTAFQQMTTAVALQTTASTGYISGMVDPRSPAMQKFYATRDGIVQIMQAQMNNEAAFLMTLPPDMREAARRKQKYSGMTQEERNLDANKAAAIAMRMIDTNTGAPNGAGQQQPSGPAGPQQPTKLGAQQQQQQQQPGQQQPRFPGSYLERVKYPPR